MGSPKAFCFLFVCFYLSLLLQALQIRKVFFHPSLKIPEQDFWSRQDGIDYFSLLLPTNTNPGRKNMRSNQRELCNAARERWAVRDPSIDWSCQSLEGQLNLDSKCPGKALSSLTGPKMSFPQGEKAGSWQPQGLTWELLFSALCREEEEVGSKDHSTVSARRPICPHRPESSSSPEAPGDLTRETPPPHQAASAGISEIPRSPRESKQTK